MRRIKRAQVQRLALCKRGKNGLVTLYKSDGTAEYATLTKGDADKGQLLTVMWPKGLADADGDFADTDAAIDSMMSSLISSGGKIDIEHDGKVLDESAVRINEVFRIQPTDERFAAWEDYDGNAVDVTGGAAVQFQIDDPALREAYRSGEFDGVSLFGPAAVEQVDVKAASQRVAARMGGVQENDMTNEELQAALATFKTEMVGLVKSAVESAVSTKPVEKVIEGEPAAESKPADELGPAPTFTGDPLDSDALAEYEKVLKGYEMRKAIASGDMTSEKLAELRKSLTEEGPSVEDLVEAGIPAKESDNASVRELQVKLFKAQKGTKAPERKDTEANSDSDEEIDLISKAAEDEGLAIAKLVNDLMGNAAQPEGMRVVKG